MSKLILKRNNSYKTPEFHNNKRIVRRQIRAAKNVYREKIEKNFKDKNPKNAWKGVKTFCSINTKKEQSSDKLSHDFIHDLNVFFCRFNDDEIYKEFIALVEELRAQHAIDRSFTISAHDVLVKLGNIQSRKAGGPDNISPKVLKHCRHSLCNIIQYIFQKCVDRGVFPKAWKLSKVIPIPKVKHPVEPNHFRPIALTSILSKCFEKFILDYVKLKAAKLYDNHQFAYRAAMSTDDALCCFIHHVTSHLNENCTNIVRCLFLDFSSAFNTINPVLLINKLMNILGLNNMLTIIADFLSDRSQFVEVNGVKSDCKLTNIGTPQGCILSPILFSLYTADLKSNNKSIKLLKFADDTALIGQIKNDEHGLFLAEIQNVVRWSQKNNLSLNASKCKEILYDFRRNSKVVPEIKINGSVIDKVVEYKYLGIHIDSKLSFLVHVESVVKKIQWRLYSLSLLKRYGAENRTLKLFYHCMIESVILYGSTSYMSLLSGSNYKPIHSLSRRIAHLVGNVPSLSSRHRNSCICLAEKIVSTPSHPLHYCFKLLPSGKRFSMPIVALFYSKIHLYHILLMFLITHK